MQDPREVPTGHWRVRANRVRLWTTALLQPVRRTLSSVALSATPAGVPATPWASCAQSKALNPGPVLVPRRRSSPATGAGRFPSSNCSTSLQYHSDLPLSPWIKVDVRTCSTRTPDPLQHDDVPESQQPQRLSGICKGFTKPNQPAMWWRLDIRRPPRTSFRVSISCAQVSASL
jgi:hypothetical protein